MQKNNLNNNNYTNFCYKVNTFDVADSFCKKHLDSNKKLSLKRLECYLFFFQIGSICFRLTQGLDIFFEVKDNFINLSEISHRHRKDASNIIKKKRTITTLKEGRASFLVDDIFNLCNSFSDAKLVKVVKTMLKPLLKGLPFVLKKDLCLNNLKKDYNLFYVKDDNVIGFSLINAQVHSVDFFNNVLYFFIKNKV